VLCPRIAPTSSVAPIIFGAPKISTALTIKRPSKKVQQTMDGRDVELWERGRFIVRLSSDLIPK